MLRISQRFYSRRGLVQRSIWLLLLALMTGVEVDAAEPTLQAGRPNIWGVWLGTSGFPDIDPRFRSTPLPKLDFTPWGEAESKRLTTPATPGECNPYGPLGYMNASSLFPMEIVRATNGVVILYESSPPPRRIYTDGRKHPDDLDPTWLGHSIGHWEDDTLVVDTVATNGRARPLNGYLSGTVNSAADNSPRLPVSDQLHLVERIRLVGNDEFLEDEITISDPKTYKQGSFKVKRYWQRRPDLELMEYFCADNLRHDAEGKNAIPQSITEGARP